MGESVSFSFVPELQNNMISILMSQQSLAMVKLRQPLLASLYPDEKGHVVSASLSYI